MPFTREKEPASSWRARYGILALAAVVGLAACGGKDQEKKTGQALVKVNGEEITTLQLNDELSRANVQPGQQEAAAKQLLESLIDRQLILVEAARNKMDRTPDVMKAIERAKAQIIAQTYVQSITSKLAKPSKVEIDDYFQKHPEFFSQRKQFDMKQLVISSNDFSDNFKRALDSAKSLDEVAAWLEKNGVRYARGQLSRSSTDMPPEMSAKLLAMPKTQLFIVREGGNSLINAIVDIRDAPVTAKDAAPQIEKYLINKKIKEAMDAEIAHLRSTAKIEYLGASAPVATPAAAAQPVAGGPETKPAATAPGN
ncbi:MAG: peptidyl-prolyl cis-trans isomerase, EpsD family [Nitrosomonadales bacterium]|nr:peptidyl-prolyl cis-trans isomerase, EpsD family [Nitrosomonadales bacterium]